LGPADLLNRWIEEREISTKDSLFCRAEPEHIVLVKLLISRDRPEEADRFLKKLIKNAQEGHRIASVIEMRLVRVRAFYAQAKIDATIEELKRSHEPGEKADQDSPSSAQYINKIFSAFAGTQSREKMAGLDESLSEREIEVLQLIAAGLTNQEIADKFFISLYTMGSALLECRSMFSYYYDHIAQYSRAHRNKTKPYTNTGRIDSMEMAENFISTIS
jgi:ATP/maltotriose-dependent transcriptional regulator MalT